MVLAHLTVTSSYRCIGLAVRQDGIAGRLRNSGFDDVSNFVTSGPHRTCIVSYKYCSALARPSFARDAVLLAQAITPDAQWHFAMGADAPHGRVRIVVAGFLLGISENDVLFDTVVDGRVSMKDVFWKQYR